MAARGLLLGAPSRCNLGGERCGPAGSAVARPPENNRFCAFCDSYLGWHDDPEPVASDRPAPPPRAPDDPPPEDGRAARLAGRGTTEDRFGLALTLSPSQVEVTPGGSARIEAKVRNRGTIVDEVMVEVEVDGAPRSWAQVEPARVALYPGVEKAVITAFSPSPDHRLKAGHLPFRITARSQLHPETAAEQDGQLDVARVTGLDLDVVPGAAAGSAQRRIPGCATEPQQSHAFDRAAPRRIAALAGIPTTPQRLDIPEFGTATTGQIQPVEAFDSTSSVNNSEGFFQL